MAEEPSPLPFDAIVDSASDGVGVLEPRRGPGGEIVDFVWRYLNPAGYRMVDQPPGDLEGRGLLEIAAHPLLFELLGRFVEAFEEEDPSAVPFEWKSPFGRGTFGVRAGRIGGFIVVRFRDLTARAALQRSEREARERLETILASISDAFCAFDEGWRFTYVNDRACRMLERSRDELIGRELWGSIPPEARRVIEPHLRPVAETGKPASFEIHITEPQEVWVAVRAYVAEQGYTVFVQDIAPERRLQAQLEEAARLEYVADLAGGVAHDFNNLLTLIAGHLSLLEERLGRDREADRDVRAIREAADRATELTRQLLSFSRRQVVRPEVVDLNRLLVDLRPVLVRLLPQGVHLEVGQEAEAVLVEIDPGELQKAIVSLAANAADAVAGKGRLWIEAARIEVLPEVTGTELAPGTYGAVVVSDEGAGMDDEVLARALEPFFTTKPAGSATGLGLSAAHGMARQAGGDLLLTSDAGVGTTARILLPWAVRAEADAPSAGQAHPELSRSMTVLLAEDNGDVREFAAHVLRTNGFRVIEAGDGDAALEAFHAADGDIDLLLTDIVMPGPTGPELARELTARGREVPVLFISGYTDQPVPRDDEHPAVVDFLPKPFGPDDLVAAVRQILEAAGSA